MTILHFLNQAADAICNATSVSAYTRMELERAISLQEQDDKNCILLIPVPANLASRFPDGKYPPHITLLYVSKDDLSMGTMSGIEAAVRRVCQETPPFRVFGDANAGLKCFGESPDGEKALWFNVKSTGPAGERTDPLQSFHQRLKTCLTENGLPCSDTYPTYQPHITWTYVPNEMADWNKESMFAASRFNDLNLGWEVRDIVLSSKMGDKRIVLNGSFR